jgi:hypothetical protein
MRPERKPSKAQPSIAVNRRLAGLMTGCILGSATSVMVWGGLFPLISTLSLWERENLCSNYLTKLRLMCIYTK